MKAREVKRAKLVAKYAAKRAALKKIIATAEDPMDAYEAARSLQAIPANANPIRLHNRCKITGRPRGFMRQFGLSRIQFREMASAGLIPGVKKASWSIAVIGKLISKQKSDSYQFGGNLKILCF